MHLVGNVDQKIIEQKFCYHTNSSITCIKFRPLLGSSFVVGNAFTQVSQCSNLADVYRDFIWNSDYDSVNLVSL